MPSAFELLRNPCLPDFWNDTYPAAAGAISMASAILIFLVEFGSTRHLAYLGSQVAKEATPSPPESPGQIENGVKIEKHINKHGHGRGSHHVSSPPFEVDAHTATNQKLGVAILEAGIIFHSIFIGLTLAVSRGSNFIALLITIVCHRNPPRPIF